MDYPSPQAIMAPGPSRPECVAPLTSSPLLAGPCSPLPAHSPLTLALSPNRTFMLSPGAEQPLPQTAQLALHQVDNLKYFLISAPVDWGNDQYIRRFLLPTGEYVSCVLWNTLFHISGTDIVRCLAFRFQAFGRPVKNPKKFEEGIFSDLRNLKAGNDASLEEPKSPFLDFLYKHNCIRTQKKQKVFYWYSVPHDRLFLDALERDLKREKAGQEPTTEAVDEPALSFEYDTSQSLFDQLTRQQQEQAGLDPNATHQYSQSPRAASSDPDSMSQQPSQLVSQPAHALPQESVGDMGAYRQASVPQAAHPHPAGPIGYENRHSFPGPAAQPIARHGSMPAAYMEYSPAPSFVSSQSYYEDNRGVSYEPVTPPQQVQQFTPEPGYPQNDEGGLYHAMPEVQQQYSNVNQFPGPSFPPQHYGDAKSVPTASSMYAHIEGSPQYRQQPRSRKSSLTYGSPAPPRPLHSVRRPSDLRRAVSASVGPMPEHYAERAASGPPTTYQGAPYQSPTPDASRHASPQSTVERQQSLPLAQSQFGPNAGEQYGPEMLPPDAHIPGPFRRARSATTSEMFTPYGRNQQFSQKTHSCPIPNCGRLFKRLEHLKRHVRTHTQERPYVCSQCSRAFSRSDNLAQHRRTHEGQPDLGFPTLPEEESEAAASGASVAETNTAESSFVSEQSYDSHTTELLSAPGTMGPPPLPATVMTTGSC